MSRSPQEEGTIGTSTPAPHLTFNALAEEDDDSLNAQGWTGDKPCLLTIDTGASVTTVRPNTAAGLPKRKPSHYILQMASWETLPILKEALVELTLGQSPIRIAVFIMENANEFILGLHVLHTYDALHSWI
jgi:hypothetical protein